MEQYRATSGSAPSTDLTIEPIIPKVVDYTDIEKLKKKNRGIVKNMQGEDLPAAQLAIQRRMNRKSVRDARDTNIIADAADKQGIDLNTPYGYPVTDQYGKELVDKLSNHVKAEDRGKLSTFISSIPSPNYIEPPKIDIEREKRQARIQRAAKWADALAIFGAGINGKSIDDKDLAFNKMQAKRDTNFQNFKNVSEANKQTAYNWKANSRKETLDWIEKQLASDALSESERKKYKLAYDQLKEAERQHNDEMALAKERIDPTVARGTIGINGREYDYNLKASDIPNLSSKAKADSEFLNQHPEFFVEYRVGDTVDEDGNKIPVTERKLNISDVDLALAYKNRFSRTRVVPLNQIPLSPEGYRTQEQFKAKQTGQQIATPVNNSPEQAIDDFFK